MNQKPKSVLLQRLRRAEYSVVVWGSVERSRAHFSFAAAAYINEPYRLWVCDGNDISWVNPFPPLTNVTAFIREHGTAQVVKRSGVSLDWDTKMD